MSRRALDHTLGLLEALDGADDAVALATVLRQDLARFGVEAIVAGLLPGPGTNARFDPGSVLLVDVPEEWRRRYLSRGYAAHDPILAATVARATGFGWCDDDLTPPRGPRANRIMAEAAEQGLRDGFTVPLVTLEGKRGGLSFAGRHLEIAPAYRGMLTLVASYAFGHALLAHHRPQPRAIRLTPREREALQWAAEGKTDWEIGEIMRISEHGVDSHLRGVRAKLGAANRAQAVAEGLRLKLIR